MKLLVYPRDEKWHRRTQQLQQFRDIPIEKTSFANAVRKIIVPAVYSHKRLEYRMLDERLAEIYI